MSSRLRHTLILAIGTSLSLVLFGCWSSPTPPRISAPTDRAQLEHGRSIVEGLAACGSCHSMQKEPFTPLSGGVALEDLYGEVQSPNITPDKTGIGLMTAQQALAAIRASKRSDGEKVSSEFHPGYQWMSDYDALAIVGYLRLLTPVSNTVEKRAVGFIDRNTKGLFDFGVETVSGFIPRVDPNNQVSYGKYLVKHVAQCTRCHTTPVTFFSEGIFLGGGKEVKVNGDVKLTPPLAGVGETGIWNWSEDQIVSYLNTGVTPEDYQINSEYCPTNFYRNAPKQQLKAIAAYLKSL